MLYEKYKNGFWRIQGTIALITVMVLLLPMLYFLGLDKDPSSWLNPAEVLSHFIRLAIALGILYVVFRVVILVSGRIIKEILEGFDQDLAALEKKENSDKKGE